MRKNKVKKNKKFITTEEIDMETKKETKTQRKVKYPISVKLGFIFSMLVIVVLGASTLIVYKMISSSEEVKAQENNQTLNSRTAASIESMFLNVQSNTNGYLNSLLLLNNDSEYKLKSDILFEDLCQRNDEILFVYSSSGLFLGNSEFAKVEPNYEKDFTKWINEHSIVRQSVVDGKICTVNISPVFGRPVLCILYPRNNPLLNKVEVIAVAFDVKKYAEILSTGSYNTSFLVNENGECLIHAETDKILSAENLSYLKAVQEMYSSKNIESQNLYPDENGKEWYYAVNPIINGNMYVFTSVSKSDVFETIKHITIRIICISLAMLFLAILVIRVFSKTITYPIEELVKAANKIEAGSLDVDLEATSQDEIGHLTESFNNMASGLQERHNLYMFTRKSVNPKIADKAISGKLHLGGENRNATIFFSDIRSFTAMSEKMTAQEVVEFLNDYMTRMVSCVEKSKGIVDKYIGDSIMAVWGAADTCGSAAKDAWSAVKAALMMRISLYEMNQERIAKGKMPVRIGCGINTGNVVAGFIGSEAEDQKWEYTVIGDAVNLASRTEALNKPFATDILITENTYELIKDKIIVEEMPAVHVKGKEQPIKMYAVINAVGVTGAKDIASLRKFLGTEAPDLAKVNPDEDEKKYQVLPQSN